MHQTATSLIQNEINQMITEYLSPTDFFTTRSCKFFISHLEGLDGGNPILTPLVVKAGEGAFEGGARMADVYMLLNGNVAPV